MRYHDQFVALNRVRQTPIKACAYRGVVFTKLRNDGLLSLLHNEKAGAQPDQHSYASYQARTNAGTFHVWLKTAAQTIAAAAKTPVTVVTTAAVLIAAKKAS